MSGPGLATVLEVQDAVKEYGGTPPVRALDGVSFDVVSGEMVAVIGPSGSGKSTLLHLIGALDRPSSGVVRVAGADVGKLRDKELSALRARRIGFVFQQFHLLHGMSAVDNVASGMVYRGVAPSERRRRAAEALDRVGLGHRVHHHPGQMSGGEQQRVAIARAIVGDPAIVLADEPTGNLDSATGTGVLDVFRNLHFGGTTIVLITHDNSVASAAPRVVALRDGKVESDRINGGGAGPRPRAGGPRRASPRPFPAAPSSPGSGPPGPPGSSPAPASGPGGPRTAPAVATSPGSASTGSDESEPGGSRLWSGAWPEPATADGSDGEEEPA